MKSRTRRYADIALALALVCGIRAAPQTSNIASNPLQQSVCAAGPAPVVTPLDNQSPSQYVVVDDTPPLSATSVIDSEDNPATVAPSQQMINFATATYPSRPTVGPCDPLADSPFQNVMTIVMGEVDMADAMSEFYLGTVLPSKG